MRCCAYRQRSTSEIESTTGNGSHGVSGDGSSAVIGESRLADDRDQAKDKSEGTGA